MALSSCIILVTFLVGTAVGQSYVLGLSGIYSGGTRILAATPTFGKATMCYNGRDIYYTSVQPTTNVGSVFRFTVGASASTTFANPTSAEINNVACCCNIVAYMYNPTSTESITTVEFLGSGINRDISIPGSGARIVALDCERGFLHVFGMDKIWTGNLNDPTAALMEITLATPLANPPRCADAFVDTRTTTALYYFVTMDGQTQLAVISSADGSVKLFEFGLSGTILTLFCVTVEDGTVSIYARTSSSEFTFTTTAITLIDTAAGTISITASAQANVLPTYVIPPSVNGITTCTNCSASCTDLPCTSCSTGCGYCSPNSNDCVCESSAPDQCKYGNSTAAAICVGPQEVPDVLCAVQYPIAKRRLGLPITVVGFSKAPAALTVGRLVKTGRWPLSALPNPRTAIADSNGAAGPNYAGFSAPVPTLARGRRFGVYFAEIAPTDQEAYRNERVLCPATENSGFYNIHYSYTRSIGEDVTMTAAFNARNQKFIPALQWRHSRTRASTDVALVPACAASLSCTLTGLTLGQEGIYEVYRARRSKRTWHPFIALFVRKCAANTCGANCGGTCPSCKQGVCDEVTCSCICHAGWTGALCNTPCAAGYIGQDCGFKCSDHFPGGKSDACENLSICQAGNAGCSCYSGLKPAYCGDACDAGFWGPNCLNTCATTPCDARTGV